MWCFGPIRARRRNGDGGRYCFSLRRRFGTWRAEHFLPLVRTFGTRLGYGKQSLLGLCRGRRGRFGQDLRGCGLWHRSSVGQWRLACFDLAGFCKAMRGRCEGRKRQDKDQGKQTGFGCAHRRSTLSIVRGCRGEAAARSNSVTALSSGGRCKRCFRHPGPLGLPRASHPASACQAGTWRCGDCHVGAPRRPRPPIRRHRSRRVRPRRAPPVRPPGRH